MAQRRTKGDGSIYQRHDHETCPPPDVNKERPEHRCQGRWVGVVDLGWSAGKRQRKIFYGRTKKEVRIKVASAVPEKDAGILLGSSPTVSEWLTHWLEVVCVEEQLKVNTMRSHRSKIERYLIPYLGRHRLDRLAPEHVRAMYADMRTRGLAEGTLRQTHAILRRAITVAMRERKVGYNVALMLNPPGTKVTTPRNPLTVAEADRLLAAGDLRWWVALYLGLRQGEALGLAWGDVDLAAGVIHIRRTLVRKPREGLVFGTPKSQASQRLLPLPPKALAHFKLAYEVAGRPGDDVLVFNREGRPLDHRADWQAWRDALTEHNIVGRPLHAARHTTATLLEAKGVPDRMVAQILGQASVKVTHNYQHGDLDRLREALALVESDAEDSPPGLSGG